MTKERIGMALWGLVGIALLGSSIMKLIGGEEVEAMLGKNALYLGLIELTCVIAMFLPATRSLGFFLCASYLGGVIATEWINVGEAPIPGVTLSTLLYVGIALYRPAAMGYLLGGKDKV
ncbi:hypothetical protein QWY85_08410 [Neolewinella lacunae]|uniref:DoxX family protein n=1 Tax=Neolewinella lacunae TaxID=1517758 RepID=A0A923PLR6_9BACT|nr:hypothetical protein [Neolewinella lacunae]MBC6994006.1 hypothetical protein [Neolewinella lacunae]MDN3634676.1 hypothetical protein [Neolewinella lacunae]